MYAYLHHSVHTVSVDVRRYVPAGGSQRWRGHIRAPFQIREKGGHWRNVYRDPIAPAWASSAAPAMYVLVAGERRSVSIRL